MANYLSVSPPREFNVGVMDLYSFPLEPEEQILKKGMASLHQEGGAWTGAFYLTTDRLVFVGYMMDISRKYLEEIPLAHIENIKGGKTFYLFPNVLQITTIRGRTVEIIVEGRDEWLKAIQDVLDAE